MCSPYISGTKTIYDGVICPSHSHVNLDTCLEFNVLVTGHQQSWFCAGHSGVVHRIY